MNEFEEYNGFRIYDARDQNIEEFVSALPRFTPTVVLSENDITLRGYFNNIFILDYSIQTQVDAKKFIDIILSVKDVSVSDMIKQYRESDNVGNKKFTMFNKYLHLDQIEETCTIAINQIINKYEPNIDMELNISY
jgi:RNA binding exosome subunit